MTKTKAQLDDEIAAYLSDAPKATPRAAKITPAQRKNLDVIRARGPLVRRHFEWFTEGGDGPIRGLNGNAIRNLIKLRLVNQDMVGWSMRITAASEEGA